jgi:hypothetical protein
MLPHPQYTSAGSSMRLEREFARCRRATNHGPAAATIEPFFPKRDTFSRTLAMVRTGIEMQWTATARFGRGEI